VLEPLYQKPTPTWSDFELDGAAGTHELARIDLSIFWKSRCIRVRID
jgi:hypothetical protein